MAERVEQAQVKLQIGVNIIQTGDAYDWRLTHIIGDTFMVADVKIGEYANKDGGYPQKQRYFSREITLYVQSKLGSAEQINATWLQLKSYMNVKLDTTISLQKHGVTRIGYGLITEVRKRDEDGMKWNQAADIKVVVTMPDPWFSSEEIQREFITSTPLFSFPFAIWEEGFTVGVVTSGDSLTFDVLGENEPGFLLTLTALGAVVNPCVTNQNGDYIKALVTMAAGDVLTIYTGGKPYVRLNGVRCPRHKLSTFYELAFGTNTITVSADSGVDSLTKLISYQERYQ